MKPSEAEEHLRVIRSLMERATIYRAISAPTALVGGLLSVIAGSLAHFGTIPTGNADGSVDQQMLAFFSLWGAVLIITGAANLWFLAQEARRRGGAFVSPGMRKALKALLPAFLAAGVLTVVLALERAYFLLPTIWMILYGLALLAAAQFSPEAIPRLGWAFLIAGLACAVIGFGMADRRILHAPHLLMALSFGGLHLLYAVCTWSAQPREEEPHV